MNTRSVTSEEIRLATNTLRNAEIILTHGYEDEELHQLSKDISQAKLLLLKSILSIVDRATETERQQRKWLVAIRQIDSALEEAEDQFTGETFDFIRGLRQTIDQSFED
jgi:hypothetical protein